jgi:hypothetical protein
MKKLLSRYLLFYSWGLTVLTISSCKKDSTAPGSKGLATLGLYELQSATNRRVFIPITQVGTQAVSYYAVFDTGSAGMTLDASGILPASMITSNGIQVAGDSVNVYGITVTSQQAVISYGDATGETQEFGNLAYAAVTIGDQNGKITTRRIPFFLYYKILDLSTNKTLPVHSNDVFGVGPGMSFANSAIASPLSYFTTGAGITDGFKLATFNNNSFSTNGTYVSGLLTIGLVANDLSSASGFIMHPLQYNSQGGYSPDIPATITYSGKSIAGTILFDTGTPSITTLADANADSAVTSLPVNSDVKITTNSGFTYQYTTTYNYNLTQIANPSTTLDIRTIFSIDFFISNEYLLNYTAHEIGLKNN